MKAVLDKRQLRITALWAFSEAFLGGLLHGFRVPFSGLVLASFASACMAAIAVSGYKKGNITHATILVLIVKATLSPHTPFTAYFAVSLQGLFGELVFSSRLPYSWSCYINSIFALMQSAFQKLIILTVLFGTGFWKAVDEFFTSIMKQFGFEANKFSIYIVGVYLLIYLIAGIIAGRMSSLIPKLPVQPEKAVEFQENIMTVRRKKKKFPAFIWLFAAIILMYLYLFQTGYIDRKGASGLIIRSLIIFIVWYFLIAPLLLKAFRNTLAKKKNAFAGETKDILNLMPEMKGIVLYSWKESASKKGIGRIALFMRQVFQLIMA